MMEFPRWLQELSEARRPHNRALQQTALARRC